MEAITRMECRLLHGYDLDFSPNRWWFWKFGPAFNLLLFLLLLIVIFLLPSSVLPASSPARRGSPSWRPVCPSASSAQPPPWSVHPSTGRCTPGADRSSQTSSGDLRPSPW